LSVFSHIDHLLKTYYREIVFLSKVSSSNSQGVRIPKLRFPGFEGEWEASQLGELGTFTKGAPLSKADISDDGTPFILYGELYTTYKEVTNDIVRKTDKEVDLSQYSRVGDVIIPTSGETPEEIATATCVMLPNVILAGDLNIFRSAKVDGRIISYIINHIVNQDISRVAQGKSVVHIKADELSKIKINYPNSEEQEVLIHFLEILSKRIEKQQYLIDLLKLYKKGVLFTKFSKVNNIVPLCEISEYFSSTNTMATISRYNTGEYPVYDASGIIANIDKYDFDKPYVAIIKDGSGVGRLQLCQSHSSIIGTLGALFPINCTVKFLFAILQTIDFRQFTTGMAIPHIYYKDYRNIAVPFPNEKTRHIIENTVSKLDEILHRENTMLCQLQQLKSGLLQQLFI